MNFLKESNVPELSVETVKVVPGWLKGLFGKEREIFILFGILSIIFGSIFFYIVYIGFKF